MNLKNKIISLLFNALNMYKSIYVFFSAWYNTILFKLWAIASRVSFGSRLQCCGRVILDCLPGTVSLGNNIIFVSDSVRSTAATVYGPSRLRTFAPTARIEIADGVGMNAISITARSRTIHIGENTMFAPNCTVVDSDFHILWPPEGRICNPGMEQDADVYIGRNCWIGMQSIILKGVTIGDGSVVGAGSVVTRDIPPNVLAAGVPARVLRPLNDNVE